MKRLMLVGGLFLAFYSVADAQQARLQKPADNEAPAAQNQAPPGQPTSADVLRSFRTLQVVTGTWLAKPEMCEGALQKHREFDDWELSLVRARSADVAVKIDHQPGWFYYQYSMVHTASGLILAAGNVTAWDGPAACNKVASLIIERIKRVRPLPESENKKKKAKDKT